MVLARQISLHSNCHHFGNRNSLRTSSSSRRDLAYWSTPAVPPVESIHSSNSSLDYKRRRLENSNPDTVIPIPSDSGWKGGQPLPSEVPSEICPSRTKRIGKTGIAVHSRSIKKEKPIWVKHGIDWVWIVKSKTAD